METDSIHTLESVGVYINKPTHVTHIPKECFELFLITCNSNVETRQAWMGDTEEPEFAPIDKEILNELLEYVK